MAKKKQTRAEETPQMPQGPSTGKQFFAALGGLLLSQVTGAVAAQASTKWGGLFSTVASGTIGGVAAAVSNHYGNPLGHATSFGMMGGAVLNGLKALLGLSKNNMLRDVGSLERVMQSAPPAANNQLPAANTSPNNANNQLPANTSPSNSGSADASAPTKTLEVKAIVIDDTVRFKAEEGFVSYSALTSRDTDGWIMVQQGGQTALLVDKDRVAWKVDNDGMIILKGHAPNTIEFASDKEKQAGIEKPFYFNDEADSVPEGDVGGLIELHDGISGLVELSGLVDLDSMDGLVDLDGEMGGLVDLDGEMSGYADPYYDDEDDEDEEDDD